MTLLVCAVGAGGALAGGLVPRATAAGTGRTVRGVLVPQARAQLVDESCVQAAQQYYRSFFITAVMRPLAQTRRMEMNFVLLERVPQSAAFAPVLAPGLGEWLSPTSPPTLGQRPGDVWYVRHPVADLDAPARYRFKVLFRWIGRGGRLIATATRMSSVCVERGRKLVTGSGASSTTTTRTTTTRTTATQTTTQAATAQTATTVPSHTKHTHV